ncbi:acetyltransferase [Bowmanella dokdonensis]|uniref:Acetyltransferase n=1 Tax=Bowmanella dokdonensis TaxID=751969 RepID=A0A939DLR1_9ALTE|nr:acetyltransferase [Bowmanella dokdonensis]MBN7825079.1 acetyltransferase [Bowmanella dokdonensis]
MQLVIIGAGGHGKVVAECAELMTQFSQIHFLDEQQAHLQHYPWPVIGRPDTYSQYAGSQTRFFIAIGDNHLRGRWVETLTEAKCKLATLIHPSAQVSRHSQIGEGTLICANVSVNPFTSLGISCIVNTGAIVEHDCKVSDLVHIAPGCSIAGGVEIGRASFLGIGTNVIQGVRIGSNVQTGAGAVVLKDIKNNQLAVGVPARVIKQRDC